jgi:small neutral amino acid transporter SnatA (MarC family)
MSAGRLFVEVVVTLVVIMDPPGMLPVFLALTGTMPKPDRVRAARLAVLVALGVISAFAVFGQAILDYLHVTLPALQAAGGLLLLLIALQLLTGQASAPESTSGWTSPWCHSGRRCWPGRVPSSPPWCSSARRTGGPSTWRSRRGSSPST